MIGNKRGECVGVRFKTKSNSKRRIKKEKYLNEGTWLSLNTDKTQSKSQRTSTFQQGEKQQFNKCKRNKYIHNV